MNPVTSPLFDAGNPHTIFRFFLALAAYWILVALTAPAFLIFQYYLDPKGWQRYLEDVNSALQGGLVFSMDWTIIAQLAFKLIVAPLLVWAIIWRPKPNILWFMCGLAICSICYSSFLDHGLLARVDYEILKMAGLAG